MKKILIIGAGRSASSLIRYLQQHSAILGWEIVVGDKNIESAKVRIGTEVDLISFDIHNQEIRDREIQKADLVISMLPPKLHQVAVLACLKYSKNLLTPSYESEELKAFEPEIKKKGLLFFERDGT